MITPPVFPTKLIAEPAAATTQELHKILERHHDGYARYGLNE
jgi:hypothetical protein